MAETTSSAATTGSNVNSTTDAAIAMAPRLYDRYPRWDGDFDSFENWLLAVDLTLSDPEMAPRLGSAAHVCGELFSCIPSQRQSECAEYIRVRQRSRVSPAGTTPGVRLPFVIEDFVQVLVTAFMPKDLAARAQKMVHAIQQGPAQPATRPLPGGAPGRATSYLQAPPESRSTGVAVLRRRPGAPLVVFAQEEGEWLCWSLLDRVDHFLGTRSEVFEFIGTAAATRGFKSDVDWDEYSNGLRA
ncbi:hypothetical protein E4U61_003078 [Claviceps capensis]|nr:hypothetical protein E4U61_003078 [Claviceps capensis]